MANRQQPIQSYYPSCRVRLIVRFEDYGAGNTPEPPDTLPQLRRGTKKQDNPETLTVQEVDGAFVLVAQGQNPDAIGSPQEQVASKDQFTHVIDGIIPISASFARNGIRTADTLTMELEYQDLPVDPRTVRSCAVQFFMGTVTADDYQKGIAGELRSEGVAENANVQYNVIPDTYVDSFGRSRTNKRFEGWVDDWNVSWPEEAGPTVQLSCTDNTRLLVETDHPTRMAMGIDVPIDKAVAQYLANFPQFLGLKVEFRPGGTEVPILKDVLNKNAFPPNIGGPSTSKGGDSKLSVWDYLTDVIGGIGLTTRFDGVTIVIQRARTLYAGKFGARFNDPYRGRELPNGRTLRRRLMIYGQNIQSMSATRNYTKYAPTNIEVRCYNPKRKKTLIARYPTLIKSKRQKRLNPGETADQKFTVIRLSGIQDQDTMRVLAQTIYETMGRRELEFNVATKNLGSFGGGNLDPDLLDMIEGDAIDIEVQRELPDLDQNTVTSIEAELRKRPEEFLVQLWGEGSRDFAKAYALASNSIEFPSTFRVREIVFDWDKDDEGIAIDLSVINYVEARADAELPEGEETEPDQTSPTPDVIEVENF